MHSYKSNIYLIALQKVLIDLMDGLLGGSLLNDAAAQVQVVVHYCLHTHRLPFMSCMGDVKQH